mgnify:CR=1 FL=1
MKSKEKLGFNSEENNTDRLVDDIYTKAISDHRVLGEIPEAEVKSFVKDVIEEMNLLEKIGERDKRLVDLPNEVIKDIEVIWVFSGPGTYDRPVKEDRYKDYPWARGMDRARLNYAAQLARKITMARTNEDFKSPLSAIEKTKQLTKKAILESGPYVIYNGTAEENENIKEVLTREGVIMPPEKVIIIEEPIEKTVDQIKTFKLPEGINMTNKEIAVVSHAPHLSRIVRMINRYKPFPPDTKIRLFPLATPDEGKKEYAQNEAIGLLYYIYVSDDHDAVEEPYHYKINIPENGESFGDDVKLKSD